MLRTFLCSARGALTSSSPSGVDRNATQTTLPWGLPSGLRVTRVASAPLPMRSRAASLSFMRCSTAPRSDSFPLRVENDDGGPVRTEPGHRSTLLLFGFLASLVDVGSLSGAFWLGPFFCTVPVGLSL